MLLLQQENCIYQRGLMCRHNDAHQYLPGMGVKGKVSIRLLFLLPGIRYPYYDYAHQESCGDRADRLRTFISEMNKRKDIEFYCSP